jgi:hypothetical protein
MTKREGHHESQESHEWDGNSTITALYAQRESERGMQRSAVRRYTPSIPAQSIWVVDRSQRHLGGGGNPTIVML